MTFDEGEKEQKLFITILKDDEAEDDEIFNLKLSNPSNGLVLSPSNHQLQVTIMANDNAFGRVGFDNSSLVKHVSEKDHEVAVHLNVVREFGSNRGLRIGYEVVGLSASEVRPSTGVVNMGYNVRRQTIIVYLQADSVPEVTEYFEVRYGYEFDLLSLKYLYRSCLTEMLALQTLITNVYTTKYLF